MIAYDIAHAVSTSRASRKYDTCIYQHNRFARQTALSRRSCADLGSSLVSEEGKNKHQPKSISERERERERERNKTKAATRNPRLQNKNNLQSPLLQRGISHHHSFSFSANCMCIMYMYMYPQCQLMARIYINDGRIPADCPVAYLRRTRACDVCVFCTQPQWATSSHREHRRLLSIQVF